jgi:aryl-alcohol dehydrogenase-like predicted oxidoreductase
MNKFKNEIAIGTAQYDKNYGMFKQNRSLDSVFTKSFSKNFNLIDTAISYKNAPSKLKKLDKKTKIVTKISLKNITYNESFTENEILKKLENCFFKHMKDMGRNTLYGLLLHDYRDLQIKNKIILKFLISLKKKNIVKKIGVSIYSVNELNYFFKFWKPDILQIPTNVFDRRFVNSAWYKISKEKKIELHCRSCFLQGTINNKFITKNKKMTSLLNKWSKFCKDNNISRTEAAINFINKYNFDYIIFGINNKNQFNEIKKIHLKQKKINVPRDISTKDEKIIDPSTW